MSTNGIGFLMKEKAKLSLNYYQISSNMHLITQTRLYNIIPLTPHFYIVKLGSTGVYIIFLFSLKNIDCGYLLEPPH